MLRKLVNLVRELGPLNAALYAADRAALRFGGAIRVYRLYFFCQAVRDRQLLPAGRAASFAVRQLTADEAVAAGVPVPPHLLRLRRRPEIVCLTAFKDDSVVGYHWMNFGSHDDEMVRCRFISLPEGKTAWGMDLFVMPKYRVGLVYARLWDETFALLRARGIAYATSYVSAFNRAAIAAEKRLGGRRMGSAVFVKLGSWQIALASLRPYLHLSVGAACKPVIIIRPRPRPLET